ncbi:MAG: tetratricopeptide repeat protein [Candidatus Lokiarchaeota archaeon]|nr:tetratricopeptide repeat protein [Candidatus Lokiarchaeota archaeon]
MSDSELKEIIQAKELTNEGKLSEALKIVSDLEERSDISDHDLLFCKLLKGRIFSRTPQYPEAINYTNQVLQESQKQGDKISYFDALLILAYCYTMSGNLIQGETILIQAEELFEKLEVATEIALREKESYMVRIRANFMALKGDTHLAQKLNERALELAKDSEDKDLKITCLINLSQGYHYLGDYDKAIYYAKRSLEDPYPPWLMWRLGILIESLLCKNDIVNAKFYFQKMSDLKGKDISEGNINRYIFMYCKALILKTSLRAKDRVKAEEILKNIIDEKDKETNFQIMIKSLLSICGLLLIELRITNDIDILNEIKPYITKLLKFSESQQSYWFLAETYLLQAKLSLLTFNIKEARRFLIQAQKIAERFDISQLVLILSKENEDLLKKTDLWENLKEREVPMAERIELARLDELIEAMTQKHIVITNPVTEERVAITKEKKICLVCKGEVLKFSYICECGAIYCDNCARALTNLENVCWVCEIQIDPLRPVKPYTEDEKKNISMKLQKGTKKK